MTLCQFDMAKRRLTDLPKQTAGLGTGIKYSIVTFLVEFLTSTCQGYALQNRIPERVLCGKRSPNTVGKK